MNDFIETIGKVRLNKQFYKGEDRYSDGDANENALLDIVEHHGEAEYNAIIMQRRSWPLLYHLSPIRENIISWFPFKPGARVLELGAGCGAVTGALLNRGLQVCAVDLSLRRSTINATRHRDCEGLTIYVGAIEDVLQNLGEPFDYVLLIGVLEYARVFSDAPEPQKYMLDCIARVMKPDGELFVAIENKIGMKYFAGCREDHTGRFFESVEGYPHRDGPRTFCKRELKALFESCGFGYEFYYPYPDYKFPMKVFTDEMPPARGELNRNWQHFDANRVSLFDESLASDVMIDAGLMDELFNSFLVRLYRQPKPDGESAIFVKSSMERRPAYRHHTLILRRDGETVVRKKPASELAAAHLKHMRDCRDQLAAPLKPDSLIGIVPCRVNGDGSIDFDYCAQKTLRDELAALRSDPAAFRDAVLRFRDALVSAYGTKPFEATEGFASVFGEAALPEGLEALGVTNLDMNFDNVFIDGGRYLIADYEWVLPFPVPLSFILYRALLSNLDIDTFPEDALEALWSSLGIDEALRETYYNMELAFQRYVSGDEDKLETFKNAAFDESFGSVNLEEMVEDHRVVGELWKRVTIAEKALAETTEELRVWKKRAPIWHKVAYVLKKRRERR